MLERFLGPVLVPRRYSRYLILGCCLGVAAVLVVLSLFANYFRAVELQLLGINAHVSIAPNEPEAMLTARQRSKIERAVTDRGDILAAKPAIDRTLRLRLASVETFPVVCRQRQDESSCFDPATASAAEPVRGTSGFRLNRSKSTRVRLRGLDIGDSDINGTDPEGIAGESRATLELGRVLDVKGEGLDLRRLAMGPDEGMPMAGYFERRLFQGASPLDDFLLAVPGRDQGSAPTLHHLRVLSTLNLGLRQTAQPILVTSLESAERLLGERSGANVFEIRLNQARLAPVVAEQLRQRLAGEELTVHTWLDQDQGALRLLGVLRWVILVVASSVMVVAALGVVSTLSLVVVEGRSKIAMLRAMGLRDRKIYLALAFEGLRIAALGLVGGSLFGAGASFALLRIPGFAAGLAKMGVADPRVMLQPSDLLWVALVTFGLFLLVAWWPARQACRIHPVAGLNS